MWQLNKLLLFDTVLPKELNDLGPLTLVGVREAMETVVFPPPPHFYCNADASRQKGDNFLAIMDRVLIGSFDITAVS